MYNPRAHVEDWSSDAALHFADRRREPRFPISAGAQIEIGGFPVQSLRGIVRDVSCSGVCLEVPTFIENGRPVRINLNAIVIDGEVRYCRPAGNTFHAGVLVREVAGPQECDELDDGELDLYAILVQVLVLGRATETK